MSRFFRALQRMETQQRLSAMAQKSEALGELSGSTSVSHGTSCSERETPQPSVPCSERNCLPEHVSRRLGSSFLGGVSEASRTSERMDLAPVIDRLRDRALPGRELGYCQMAAHILSQFPPGPSAIFLFFGLANEPAPTSALAPLAAVLGEVFPAPVLGLDARWDRAELAECFGLACRWTLADVLAGQTPIYEAVRKTSLGDLFLLAGAPPEQLQWSHVSDESWRRLLGQLRKRYRLILIDGGRHPHPAQKPLLTHCDGVYLVVHLGRTPKGVLHRTVADIQQAGARVLGCIAASLEKSR